MSTDSIIQVLEPKIKQYFIEFINFLHGISTKNISAKGEIILPSFADELLNGDSVLDIVDSIINSCERKKCLGYVINGMMSPFQFCNIAGFNLVNIFGDFQICYKGNQSEVKTQWHTDMLKVLTETIAQTTLSKSTIPKKIFIAACEEYKMDAGPSIIKSFNKKKKLIVEAKLSAITKDDPKLQELLGEHQRLKKMEQRQNTNENEFETYQVNPDGNYESLPKQSLNTKMFHNYHIDGRNIILNIHNSSSMKGPAAIKEIYELLGLFNSLYPGYYIILCGDSNVYYNSDTVKDITQLGNMFRTAGYNMLLSKFAPIKIRPRNFFQNAQSAEKGFENSNEETMFIAYPMCLQSSVAFDHTKYFIATSDESKNLREMNYHQIWAFEGSHLGFNDNDKEGWEGINISNYHEYLFSDHMPIYMDINGIRIIAANNVSIMGSRGVNYNQENFMPGIKVNDLEKLTNEVLLGYFTNIIIDLIGFLIKTESTNSLISMDAEKRFYEIITIQDDWHRLKELCQLTLY